MANFFQEMAYHHANQLGFGYDDLKEKQTFWVLSRMKIRIDQYPVWDDKVSVETWHRGMERLFGLRDFRVMDQSGKILGKATTAWLILDSQTRRPVRAVDDVLTKSKGDESVFDAGLNKISSARKSGNCESAQGGFLGPGYRRTREQCEIYGVVHRCY